MAGLKKSIFLRGIVSYSFANIIIYALSLISVPLFINSQGLTKYGIWTVLLTLVSYLSNSQFGLGTVTSVLIAKTENEFIHKTIFTRSIDILIIISIVLFILGVGLYINPSKIMALIGDVPADLITETSKAFCLLYFFFIFRLPFISVAAAFVGHQDVQFERLYVAILPQIWNFIALIIVRSLGEGLVLLALLVGAGNLAICVASAAHFYMRNKYFYALNRHDLVPEPSRSNILKNGGVFFFAGLSSMIIMNTDNLILSHLFGVDKVASYSLTYKIFTIAFSLFFILNSALWPMFGRAYAKKEMAWIKTIFLEASISFPLLGGLIWVGGMAFMDDFIRLWIGSDKGFAGLSVVFALGGYGYVASVVNFQNGLLSSVNEAKPFMWIGMAEATVNLVLSLLLCRLVGPSGVAYGTLLATVFTSFILIPKAIEKHVSPNLVLPFKKILLHFLIVLLPSLILVAGLRSFGLGKELLFGSKIAVILAYVLGCIYFIPTHSMQMLKNKIGYGGNNK